MTSDPGGLAHLDPENPQEDTPLPEDWAEHLEGEYHKDYWARLMSFVGSERRQHEVYPPPSRTFAAFHLTPYAATRVVILGQDPYHAPGQAHGLCFSVPRGVRKPRSLLNIRKELAADLEVDPPAHGSLEGWTSEGVLLLNTTLTVRKGQPGSHRGQGWEQFTDEVIRAVSRKPERVVFLLWGADAARKAELVDESRHSVVLAAHPTARANAKVPFLGSRPFSTANRLLEEAQQRPVDWTRLEGGAAA